VWAAAGKRAQTIAEKELLAMAPTEQLIQQLAPCHGELVARLQEILGDTLFSNRSFIRPADVRRIAAASAQAFFAFLENQNTAAVRSGGVEQAQKGLGEQAVLRMGAAMRQFFSAHAQEELLECGLALTDAYTQSFMEGFIDARERVILDEQERIRAALQSALSRYTLQLQTSAEVAHAASSLLDPDKVLVHAVDLIRERFGFHYVGLFLLDESGAWAVLRAGAGEGDRRILLPDGRLEVNEASAVGACIAQGRARILSDVDIERGFPVRGEAAADAVLLPDTRSAMALPLISRGQVIGAMIIQSTRATAFGEQDLAGLSTLAGQLSNAIENARLYAAAQQEIAERRRAEAALEYLNQRLAALLEVAAGLETMSDPHELPERLVSALAGRLGYDLVVLCKLEDGTPSSQWSASLSTRPTRNVGPWRGCSARPPAGLLAEIRAAGEKRICERSIPHRALLTGQPVFVRDVSRDPDYRGSPAVRSEICCTLQDAAGPIGLLDILSCQPLDEADFTVIQAAARLAATALINARLYEQTQRQAAELEERVAQRTAELAAVNKELEAFAYSVSHDLRAPLRSMDGFSQALLEDYADRLDEEGQDYLRRVRAASQRMAELIDDLLKLSRITRGEIRHERVDLSALARAIAGELARCNPERQVEFVITPGLVARGDARLMQVVLENLLDNAWKFTSRHDRARIEFGAQRANGQTVYFVRDDGAGFDMAYADRLFGPFQRLHAMTEFEGNGIGLATVQRVIGRHGGRIWAEGAVEQGAAFYFTL
jgi:signal transduction histidine kinase